jgi:hypothetical protein
MRLIKTFVLHLYVDSEAPERICGNVRPLEDSESYSFKNPIEFEVLLYRLVKLQSETITTPPSSDTSPEK